MSSYRDLRLKYKIHFPALFCLTILAVVLVISFGLASFKLQNRTLPGERVIQQVRNDAALLSSGMREYILTNEPGSLERVNKLRLDVASGLDEISLHLKEDFSTPELLETGEEFLFLSGKVVHIREEMQVQIEGMQRIEDQGSERWVETRSSYQAKASKIPDWDRIEDTLVDMGSAAEFYHLSILRSIWSIRSVADAKANPENQREWSHHPLRASQKLRDSVEKVRLQMPELLEKESNVTTYALLFIEQGNLILETSVGLWESIGDLEKTEDNFDKLLHQAAQQTYTETNRVFRRGRITVLLSLLGAMILLAVLMGLFAEHISNGLEELVVGASRFGLGNLSFRVDDRRGDEVGDLARAFNHMADELERSINELHRAEQEVIGKEREAAHEAGKAEVSTTILHNVGNVLNSVIISAQVVQDMLSSTSRLDVLARANENLKELETSLSEVGERGRKLLAFYPRYYELLKREDARLLENTQRIASKVELIRDVIRSQQGFAKSGLQMELSDLAQIVDDALIMEESGIHSSGIQLIKNYQEVPKVWVQRNKLTHILLNLLRNARQAMAATEKKLRISLDADPEYVYIRLADSGEGIPLDDLKKIFQHGYTTKTDGHGFGLHGSANSMSEMNGHMWAESAGQGSGATFVLAFPTVARYLRTYNEKDQNEGKT